MIRMASLSGLTLEVLAERLAIVKLSPDADVPQLPLGGPLLSLTVTRNEISIVCPEDTAPKEGESAMGWRALRVVGDLDFSLVGIMATLTSVLAEAEVSVFVISTYTTDYLLVREASLEQTVAVLRAAGHTIIGA